MTTLRKAAQQALEALLTPSGAQACSTCQNGPENEYCCRMEMWSAVDALRAALAQQEEPVWMHPWPPVRAQQAEPLTIERLRYALVASRIIPPAAVEDPDRYDDGVTLFRIEALHRRIT